MLQTVIQSSDHPIKQKNKPKRGKEPTENGNVVKKGKMAKKEGCIKRDGVEEQPERSSFMSQ